MAGYDKSKSLNEAKNWRRELATRVEPAVASAPRTHSGLKREDPASIKSSWQRIDEGENVAPHPYTATYSIGNDSSPPLKKSRRRCYTEEEKAQVAETRRRGACGKCRASRIKCHHDPSPIATDQYQRQSESHEIFALGLTTPSLTANKDGHKQVIKETIAAIDDKLVNAQNCPVEQSQEASKEASPKVQVLASPPEPTILKELSSQQRTPAEVHHVKAPPSVPKTFQEGVNTFRVFDSRKPRQGKKSQQTKANSVVSNQTPLGIKNSNVGKTPTGSQSFGCQRELPGGSCTSVIKEHNSGHLTLLRSNPQRSGDSATPKIIQPRCKTVQSSEVKNYSEVPRAPPIQSKTDWRSPARPSISSSKDPHTLENHEDSTSPERPSSPMSAGASSEPRSFVSLPELSLGRSTTSEHDLSERPISTSLDHLADEQTSSFAQDMLAMLGIEGHDVEGFQGSYTELLNTDISTAAPSNSDHTYMAASQSNDISLHSNAAPEFVAFSDFMEVDELL